MRDNITMAKVICLIGDIAASASANMLEKGKSYGVSDGSWIGRR